MQENKDHNFFFTYISFELSSTSGQGDLILSVREISETSMEKIIIRLVSRFLNKKGGSL